jgi:hypothetical protein
VPKGGEKQQTGEGGGKGQAANPTNPNATTTVPSRNYFNRGASADANITTKRVRGESAMDMFEMEDEEGRFARSDSGTDAWVKMNGRPGMLDTEGANAEAAGKEGNLSRSPSSTMLFPGDEVGY